MTRVEFARDVYSRLAWHLSPCEITWGSGQAPDPADPPGPIQLHAHLRGPLDEDFYAHLEHFFASHYGPAFLHFDPAWFHDPATQTLLFAPHALPVTWFLDLTLHTDRPGPINVLSVRPALGARTTELVALLRTRPADLAHQLDRLAALSGEDDELLTRLRELVRAG